jgi:hypothetical protein
MDFMRAKKNGIQVATRKVRVERVVEKKKAAPLPSKIELERQRERQRTREVSAASARPSPSTGRSSYSPVGERSVSASRNGNGHQRKRKALEREQRSRGLSSSPETEGEGTPAREIASRGKRVRIVDESRRLKSRTAFSGTSEGCQGFAMIHAADIASPARATNRDGYREDMVIKLQYPSDSQKER